MNKLLIFSHRILRTREYELIVTLILFFILLTFLALLQSHHLLLFLCGSRLALNGAFLELDLFLLLVLQLLGEGEVKQANGVRYEILFDLEIQRGVGAEGGRVVDLQNPGLKVRVKHDVETEDLEAHRVLDVIWLAATIDVRQLGLHRTDGFDNRGSDVPLHLVHVVSLLS